MSFNCGGNVLVKIPTVALTTESLSKSGWNGSMTFLNYNSFPSANYFFIWAILLMPLLTRLILVILLPPPDITVFLTDSGIPLKVFSTFDYDNPWKSMGVFLGLTAKALLTVQYWGFFLIYFLFLTSTRFD